MTLPYANSTAGQAREAEIRKVLRSVGATAVGFMVDDDRDCIILQFRLRGREITMPVNIGAYAEAWLRENPPKPRSKMTEKQRREKAHDIAERASWAVLADWCKAQAAMMQCGFLTEVTAFLPHIHTRSGQRVIDAIDTDSGPLALPAPDEGTEGRGK